MDDRPYNERPYIRLLVNEVQWPVVLEAFTEKEYVLRQEYQVLREKHGSNDQRTLTAKARHRAMMKERELLLDTLVKRGWMI
jgi:hypothetical protein